MICVQSSKQQQDLETLTKQRQQDLESLVERLVSLRIQSPSDAVKTDSESSENARPHAMTLEASKPATVMPALTSICASPNASVERTSQYDSPSGRLGSISRRERHYSLETLLGSFNVELRKIDQRPSDHERRSHLGAGCTEYQSSLAIVPSLWLTAFLSCVLNMKFAHSWRNGLTFKLSTNRLVPNDSKIFEYSKDGNISGVRYLLAQGHASVTDVDSCGRTALYVSLATLTACSSSISYKSRSLIMDTILTVDFSLPHSIIKQISVNY